MNKRAEFNYVTPLVILFVAAGFWACTQFIPAYYQKAQFTTDLSGILVSSRRVASEEVPVTIFNFFKDKEDIEIVLTDVTFIRKEENVNLVSAAVNYRRLIHIPFKKEPFRLEMSIESNQDFTVSNSFN